ILSISLLILSVALLIATAPLLAELLMLTTAALLPLISSRREEKISENEGMHLRLAVVVPAHNEEALIGRCVRSVIASQQKCVEVFVVAHNCNDNTEVEAVRAG